MNGVDIALILGFLAFAVHGFSKGLVSKVLSLAALVAGIIVAAKYSKEIAMTVQSTIGGPETACGIIGIVLVFVVLLAVASILKKAFKKLSMFELWDKIGGAVFGVFEGALVLSIFLLILSIFDIPAAGSSASRSFLYQPTKNFAGEVYSTFLENGSTEKWIDDFFLKGLIGRSSTK
jgi:membrane protein required for colicin V production